MDSSFNDSDFNEDFVRAPDKPKREQLLDDIRSDFEKQMDEAISLSIKYLKEQEEKNKKYEEELINEHLKNVSKRRDIFHNLLFDLNRLSRFDKEIKNIYEIIEPIIDAYCDGYIQAYQIDTETYDKIFKNIKNIRTDKNGLEKLREILSKYD